MADRNAIIDAVARLVANVTFSAPINGVTTWRTSPYPRQKLRLFSDIPPDQQPACFVVTHRELDEYRGLGLERRRLELGLWCYSRADEGVVGAVDLDNMLAALEVALAPDRPSQNLLTLNNLVYFCRIEGRVFKDPGDIDKQTLLIVPLVVEMP